MCDKQFTRQDYLKSHIRKYLSLVCPNCSKSFEKRKQLTQHIKRNHVLHVCPSCSKSFEQRFRLDEHIKRKHTEKQIAGTKSILEHKSCLKCGKLVSNLRSLRRHMTRCQLSHKCLQCEQVFGRKKYLKLHLKAEHRKPVSMRTLQRRKKRAAETSKSRI